MKQIIDEIAKEFDTTKKTAGELFDFVINSLADAIQEKEKIKISRFGTFTIKTRKARKARNPKTGESIDVPEKKVVTFKAATQLNDFIK